MEKPIIIAPLVCLPPMKEVHAKEREQDTAGKKKSAKDKTAQNKPKKGKGSTSK